MWTDLSHRSKQLDSEITIEFDRLESFGKYCNFVRTEIANCTLFDSDTFPCDSEAFAKCRSLDRLLPCYLKYSTTLALSVSELPVFTVGGAVGAVGAAGAVGAVGAVGAGGRGEAWGRVDPSVDLTSAVGH